MKIPVRLLRVAASISLMITALVGSLSGKEQHPDSGEDEIPPALMAELETIKNTALRDGYAYRQVAYLSERIGARQSGSAAANKAVEYVANQMRRLGLQVQLEPVNVPHWLRGDASATVVDDGRKAPRAKQKFVIAALRGSSSTGAQGLTAAVVVVENFDQLKALPISAVAGKIVVFNEPFEVAPGLSPYTAYRRAVRYREMGPKAAAQRGAVAALVRSVGTGNTRLAHAGDSEPAGIPAASISLQDADLLAQLARERPLRIHLVLTPKRLPNQVSYNVIADLKGKDHPEQLVIISAHLDSWDLGRGALDDGAGIGTAMATMHLIQQLHLRPSRTLRFIAWMDEENDGSGSAQYAKEHAGELANTVLAMESDVGASKPIGFQGALGADAIAELNPVRRMLAAVGADQLIAAQHPPGTTDLDPLADAGVSTLGILNDGSDYFVYHHTAADTLDKVNRGELQENVAAFATMAYAAASIRYRLPH